MRSFPLWKSASSVLAKQEALVNEVRLVSYILLLISAALLALLLGMVLNAVGFKL